MHDDYATLKGNYHNQHALEFGGAKQDQTADLLRARQALSQLSYSPIIIYHPMEVVGLGRLELPTSPLSGVRSNQLSYKPIVVPSTRYVFSFSI